ncbi:hypothetical protein BDM02DRAFT_991839 [Thelephora ganbajun]|uniref:Uncharacterized protein n=1 Tax=Thelephora ganbajun TaxID=370292 RepID=A0ACB6Z4U4_THEGA|nr:hypothetical protein BDM02DRAFT_991839 [Thelephora ganbajun]
MCSRQSPSPCSHQGTQPSRWKNSTATSVSMHHQDLVEIHAVAGLDDISSISAAKRPRIVVEEDRAARIVWRENRQLAQQDDSVVAPGPLQPHDLDRALPQLHRQQTVSWPLSRRNTQSPEGAESAQEEPQEVTAQISKGLQPSPPALQQLHHPNMSSPDFRDQLCRVLYGQGYK